MRDAASFLSIYTAIVLLYYTMQQIPSVLRYLPCRNYAELNDATLIVGTILAQSYITATGANVQGATISLGAAVTFTGAAVRLPLAAALLQSHGTGNSSATYQTSVNMMRARSFAILGATTLTNTGPSVIVGDCGSYPGAEAAGGPVGTGATLRGIDYAGSSVSAGAHTDLDGIYADLSSRALTPMSTGIASQLASITLYPGVYHSTNQYFTLDGTLIFDAQNNGNAVFVIVAPGTGYLAVSPGSQMLLVNGAKASNVFWALGSYFEANSGSSSVGTVIAQSYVTLTGASMLGAVFSMNAAATLTVSSVRLPDLVPLTSGPSYTAAVNMLSVSSFAVLAGSALVNTGPSVVVGNVGCYPGTSDQISVRIRGRNYRSVKRIQTCKRIINDRRVPRYTELTLVLRSLQVS